MKTFIKKLLQTAGNGLCKRPQQDNGYSWLTHSGEYHTTTGSGSCKTLSEKQQETKLSQIYGQGPNLIFLKIQKGNDDPWVKKR